MGIQNKEIFGEFEDLVKDIFSSIIDYLKYTDISLQPNKNMCLLISPPTG